MNNWKAKDHSKDAEKDEVDKRLSFVSGRFARPPTQGLNPNIYPQRWFIIDSSQFIQRLV